MIWNNRQFPLKLGYSVERIFSTIDNLLPSGNNKKFDYGIDSDRIRSTFILKALNEGSNYNLLMAYLSNNHEITFTIEEGEYILGSESSGYDVEQTFIIESYSSQKANFNFFEINLVVSKMCEANDETIDRESSLSNVIIPHQYNQGQSGSREITNSLEAVNSIYLATDTGNCGWDYQYKRSEVAKMKRYVTEVLRFNEISVPTELQDLNLLVGAPATEMRMINSLTETFDNNAFSKIRLDFEFVYNSTFLTPNHSIRIEVDFQNDTLELSDYGISTGIAKWSYGRDSTYKTDIIQSISSAENTIDILELGGYRVFNDFNFEIVDYGMLQDITGNGGILDSNTIVCLYTTIDSVDTLIYKGCISGISKVNVRRVRVSCQDIALTKEASNRIERYLVGENGSLGVTPSRMLSYKNDNYVNSMSAVCFYNEDTASETFKVNYLREQSEIYKDSTSLGNPSSTLSANPRDDLYNLMPPRLTKRFILFVDYTHPAYYGDSRYFVALDTQPVFDDDTYITTNLGLTISEYEDYLNESVGIGIIGEDGVYNGMIPLMASYYTDYSNWKKIEVLYDDDDKIYFRLSIFTKDLDSYFYATSDSGIARDGAFTLVANPLINTSGLSYNSEISENTRFNQAENFTTSFLEYDYSAKNVDPSKNSRYTGIPVYPSSQNISMNLNGGIKYISSTEEYLVVNASGLSSVLDVTEYTTDNLEYRYDRIYNDYIADASTDGNVLATFSHNGGTSTYEEIEYVYKTTLALNLQTLIDNNPNFKLTKKLLENLRFKFCLVPSTLGNKSFELNFSNANYDYYDLGQEALVPRLGFDLEYNTASTDDSIVLSRFDITGLSEATEDTTPESGVDDAALELDNKTTAYGEVSVFTNDDNFYSTYQLENSWWNELYNEEIAPKHSIIPMTFNVIDIGDNGFVNLNLEIPLAMTVNDLLGSNEWHLVLDYIVIGEEVEPANDSLCVNKLNNVLTSATTLSEIATYLISNYTDFETTDYVDETNKLTITNDYDSTNDISCFWQNTVSNSIADTEAKSSLTILNEFLTNSWLLVTGVMDGRRTSINVFDLLSDDYAASKTLTNIVIEDIQFDSVNNNVTDLNIKINDWIETNNIDSETKNIVTKGILEYYNTLENDYYYTDYSNYNVAKDAVKSDVFNIYNSKTETLDLNYLSIGSKVNGNYIIDEDFVQNTFDLAGQLLKLKGVTYYRLSFKVSLAEYISQGFKIGDKICIVDGCYGTESNKLCAMIYHIEVNLISGLVGLQVITTEAEFNSNSDVLGFLDTKQVLGFSSSTQVIGFIA